MKTKKVFISVILFYLFNSLAFAQEKNATLINNTNLVITRLDNVLLENEAQRKTSVTEGYHTAELRLYVMSGMLYRNLITSYKIEFTAEKDNTYQIDFLQCNYIDTLDNCYYYKAQYVNVVEKETKKIVGGICNTKIESPNLDSSNFSHLYYGSVLPKSRLVNTVISRFKFDYYYLVGKSFDGLNIKYGYKSTDVYKKEVESLYLKPGYYRFYGSGKEGNWVMLSEGAFKATEGQTINYTISGITSNIPFVKLDESSLNDVFFLPDGMHGWIVGNEGIILKTSNGGKTWSYISIKSFTNDELYKKVYKKDLYCDLTRVYFLDSLQGWIVGVKGILFRSTDGGNTWSFQNCGNKNTLDAIYFKNAKVGFIGTHLESTTSWNFLGTHDGGRTWKNIDKSIHPTKYHLLDSNYFYKIIADKIYRSKDCGLNWDVQLESKVKSGLWTDALNYTISDIFFIDEKNGWVLKQDSLLFTENDGITWKSKVWPLTNMRAFYFVDNQDGYAVGTDGRILFTSDCGMTWQKIKSGTIENLNDIEFKNNNGWIVGALGGILQSNDAGKNWKYYNVLDFVQK